MGLAGEIVLVALAFLVFGGYHFWLFYLKGKGLTTVGDTYGDIFAAGKVSRTLFTAEILSKESDAILAVQTFRNCIMANTFFAGIVSILATQILAMLIDKEGVDRIEEFYRKDPVVNNEGGIIPATVILGCLMGVAFFSVLAFVHSVRMYVHAGFFFKAYSSPFNKLFGQSEVVVIIVQAQAAFTIGMRVLFFFFVMTLWIIGPVAFFCASVIATLAIALLDMPPKSATYKLIEVVPNLTAQEVEEFEAIHSSRGIQSNHRMQSVQLQDIEANAQLANQFKQVSTKQV
eukprot:TRINITY_DN7366_c0_g1_i4.p1 TRINITY_DN7366_c0_g1~~TRINITY_DN7366_c0_g1_i4.p1  ORF type:complete len:288 (+),score=45.52 TRINITY_DN7366_c0_g1_i4:88-951(+)